MPELLKRAQQLLNDDDELERIARKTQEAVGLDGTADYVKDLLIQKLKNYVEEEKNPITVPSSPWNCVERARKNHRKRNGNFRRREAEQFLDCIDRNGSILPESFYRHPAERRFSLPLQEENQHCFEYKRVSRLTAHKQDILFNDGIFEHLFEQLDDVLLEDYRPVKYFSGQGGFGVVTLVEDRNGKRVVLKKISLAGDNRLIELENILRLREPLESNDYVVQILNIGVDVEIFGDSTCNAYAFYTMEAADDLNSMCPDAYGWYQPFTLDYFLRKQEFRLDRRRFSFLFAAFFQIIAGVAGLHIKQMIHRDLKPGNIAIFNGKAKIIDLGLMTPVDQEGIVAGTPFFCPEEVLKKGRPQTQGDDAYALGKLLYNLLTLLPPQKYPEYPEWWPEQDKSLRQAKKLIARACSSNIKKRFKSAGEFLISFMTSFGIEIEKYLPAPKPPTD